VCDELEVVFLLNPFVLQSILQTFPCYLLVIFLLKPSF
jgi:hypothetical protein